MGRILFASNKYLFIFLSILALLGYAFFVQAAYPTTQYNPGETLDPSDPACIPGATNCSVAVPFLTDQVNGYVYNNNALHNNAFIFGDDNLTWTSGEEVKMIFNTSAKAIRMGSVDATTWDTVGARSVAIGFANVSSNLRAPQASGAYSVAFGSGTVASGTNSTAFGKSTTAGSNATAFGENTTAGSSATAFGYGTSAGAVFSTAFGKSTTASNTSATAFGEVTTASGFYSTAFGYHTTASSIYATAFGANTLATNGYATAFGDTTQATGNVSTAFGYQTTASGTQATAFGNSSVASGTGSTAFGNNTEASGVYSSAFGKDTFAIGAQSTAFGTGTIAGSFSELALGTYATEYSVVDPVDFAAADRMLVIGKGADDSNRHDAFTILKSGLVGIGYDNFEATANSELLQVNGLIRSTGSLVTSDSRLKNNVNNISYGLNAVNQLRPVSYNLNSDGSAQLGFIAQEIQPVLPELVANGNYLALNYIGFIPVLTKAIQELDVKISNIEAQATTLMGNQGFLNSLIAWFANSANGIQQLFTHEVHTDTLCVGTTCVTEVQLQQLLQQNNVSVPPPPDSIDPPQVTPDPIPEPDPVPDVVPDPIPDTPPDSIDLPQATPDPVPEPTPEPVPDPVI